MDLLTILLIALAVIAAIGGVVAAIAWRRARQRADTLAAATPTPPQFAAKPAFLEQRTPARGSRPVPAPSTPRPRGYTPAHPAGRARVTSSGRHAAVVPAQRREPEPSSTPDYVEFSPFSAYGDLNGMTMSIPAIPAVSDYSSPSTYDSSPSSSSSSSDSGSSSSGGGE